MVGVAGREAARLACFTVTKRTLEKRMSTVCGLNEVVDEIHAEAARILLACNTLCVIAMRPLQQIDHVIEREEEDMRCQRLLASSAGPCTLLVEGCNCERGEHVELRHRGEEAHGGEAHPIWAN